MDRQADEALERKRRAHPEWHADLPDVADPQAVPRHGGELAARTRRAHLAVGHLQQALVRNHTLL